MGKQELINSEIKKATSVTEKWFKVVDKDGNGSISMDEWIKFEKHLNLSRYVSHDDKIIKNDFKEKDLNKDGKISLQEALKHMKAQLEAMNDELLQMDEADIKDVFEECNQNMENGIKEYK